MKHKQKKSAAIINTQTERLLLAHLQALMNSLGQLSRSLSATLLTITVIGIALALPLGFAIFLHNIHVLSDGLNDTKQISVYLADHVGNQQAQQVLKAIQLDADVKQATYISPEEGLTEFSKNSDFGDVLKDLKTNPLPGVIAVTPSESLSPTEATQLVDRFQHLPSVASAHLDMQWLERLQAILDIGRRAATLLTILFAFAVLLIIGNTIRLTTQSHYDEILIIKIIGGTDRFIRRPFLYSGMLYGLAGAIIAWFLIDFSIWFLKDPISHLASLYGSSYQLEGLSASATLLLLVGAVLLGLLASWMAVNRYIRDIEPR